MRPLILLVVAAAACPAADNTLTVEERRSGWTLVFDGASFGGWRDPARETPPGDSWEIENGCLKTRLKPRIAEDLISAESYGDFELVFDWRIAPGGNSGVKYRIQRQVFIDNTKIQGGPGGFEGMLYRELSTPVSARAALAPEARAQVYVIAFEMQLLDDDKHPDARNGPKYQTGALYSMLPRTAAAARPPGEWNTGRIVARGSRVEHWVNGVKVLDGDLADPEVRAGVQKRWGPYPEIFRMFTEPKPSGPISLQHHGDLAWFRNIKIRRL
jgi:hypothetical protein